MARVKKNLLTKGLSGQIGDTLVFRNVGDQTLVSASPNPSEKEASEKQVAQRGRFQQAAIYAKSQMDDATAKAQYAQKAKNKVMQSAFSVAVADFFHAPSITAVDLKGYTGAIGDTIRVTVSDDFMVALVEFEITNQDGTLVERGNAVQVDRSSVWVFTATAQNANVAGDKIVIRATDKPGNTTSQEKTM